MSAEVRGKGIREKGDIPGVKNVIAVGSGKGGVGKSTMAAAIAYGLQAYGSKVGLIDADVYGPSIPHLLGASGRPTAPRRSHPADRGGRPASIMSMGFLLDPDKAVIMRGPMLDGIMQQFLHQVDWGTLDYLVIDLPPGTGDVPLSLAQKLPLTGAVVVCTPQEVALLDATRAVTMFRQLKVPMLGMIENMSFFDVQAYLKERGGPKVRQLLETHNVFDVPGDERAYLFGRGGAPKGRTPRRAVPRRGSPEHPRARVRRFRPISGCVRARRCLAAVLARGRRTARRSDQHSEHQDAQDAEAGNPELTADGRHRRPPGRIDHERSSRRPACVLLAVVLLGWSVAGARRGPATL